MLEKQSSTAFLHFASGKQMANFDKGRLLPKWPKNRKFNVKFSFKLKIKLTSKKFYYSLFEVEIHIFYLMVLS